MLISAARQPLIDGILKLPDWIRAPLYLSDGTRLYAALESKTHSTSYIELAITAFDPPEWDDLWGVEIDTDDNPGNSLLLFSLLASRGFQVLAAESSINSFARNHGTTVICAGRGYSGDQDLTHRERLNIARPELHEMYRESLVYFGDQIGLNPDRSPALKWRHLRSYRRLAEELRSGSRFLLSRTGLPMRDSSLQLTPRAMDHITALTGDGDIEYSCAVDTKERMIRVLFFGMNHPRCMYAQIAIETENVEALAGLYAVFFKAGANIIRNTIRPTPAKVAVDRIRAESGVEKFEDQVAFVTLDVTFNFLDAANARLLKKGLSALDGGLKKFCAEHKGAAFVTRRSWS